IDDIGAFAALAFGNPGHYLGKAIEITGDRLTTPQIADALSTAVGRPIPHAQIPLEILWERVLAAAKVFTWANERYYDTDLAPLRRAHPRPHGLRHLARPNRQGPAPGATGVRADLTGAPHRHRAGAGDVPAWRRSRVRRPIRLMAGLLTA